MLLQELRFLAFRPGIVCQAELNTVPNGWMIIKDEYVHWIWIGIRQANVSQYLECLRGHLARIRGEPMREFECILICLVFKVTTDSAGYRITHKSHDRKQK